MSCKAPVQTFENYASYTPQKMNCIASPIPFTTSLQLPKFYPPYILWMDQFHCMEAKCNVKPPSTKIPNSVLFIKEIILYFLLFNP
jgi:hypothetical protein